MRVYISGAITGTNDFMERFKAVEDKLTSEGMSVINPAHVNSYMPKDTTYEEYMKVSFCLLDMCEAIYMIDGWQKSCGANREYGYAIAKEKIVMSEKKTCDCGGKGNMERLTERTGEGQAITRMELRNNGHQKCMERLAEYEDLEEQGKLLKLPCSVGDVVYADSIVYGILRYEVCSIEIGDTIRYHCVAYSKAFQDFPRECLDEMELDISDFGKTVFFAPEEAEAHQIE